MDSIDLSILHYYYLTEYMRNFDSRSHLVDRYFQHWKFCIPSGIQRMPEHLQSIPQTEFLVPTTLRPLPFTGLVGVHAPSRKHYCTAIFSSSASETKNNCCNTNNFIFLIAIMWSMCSFYDSILSLIDAEWKLKRIIWNLTRVFHICLT